jgi:hypothetical protein
MPEEYWMRRAASKPPFAICPFSSDACKALDRSGMTMPRDETFEQSETRGEAFRSPLGCEEEIKADCEKQRQVRAYQTGKEICRLSERIGFR